MASIYLSELENRQLFLKKGVKIPLYKEPLFGFGTPEVATQSVRNVKKNYTEKKPLFLIYRNNKSSVTLGKLIEYNGVKYFTTVSGYLIPASSKWFNIANDVKTGTIKTAEKRDAEKEQTAQKEESNTWYNKLTNKVLLLGGAFVAGYLLINNSKNGNKRNKK